MSRSAARFTASTACSGDTSITASGRCSSNARSRDSRARTTSSSRALRQAAWPGHGVQHGIHIGGQAEAFVRARAPERVVVEAVCDHGDGQARIRPLDAPDAEHERVGFGSGVDDEGGRMWRLEVLGGEADEALADRPTSRTRVLSRVTRC